MTGAHLHLMFIHFPIAGMILALPVLLAGWWLKNEGLKWAGLGLVLVAGLATGGAFFTGEAAEELVENLPGITHGTIHEHEEAAEFALWPVGLTSLLAAYGLFLAFRKKAVPSRVFVAVLVLTLFCAVTLARVSNLGGFVHHEEIRPGFTAPAEGPKD
jgi:uncharacterized membrane protein